jgi:putative ABC transport system ATP-binding protein
MNDQLDIVLTDIVVTIPPGRRSLFRINSFRIPFGSRVLVQGPSGIGKTTLLHLVSGLFLPDEGDVFIGNNNLRLLTETQRGKLRRNHFGIVFQRLNLIDHLNALENVVLPLPPRSESIEHATLALDKVNLAGLRKERVANLSLGEQQRVAIARVLASAPSIILADEPTSSLDQKNEEDVLSALWEVSDRKTLLVVSHDQRIRSRFDIVVDFEQITSQ